MSKGNCNRHYGPFHWVRELLCLPGTRARAERDFQRSRVKRHRKYLERVRYS